MSSPALPATGVDEFVHPDALGVRRFASSRFVTLSASGTLSVTRVLRWEGEKGWATEISGLPRGRPRPDVYCPFCGRVGQYALTDNHCYFRHGDGEQDCVTTALEHVRHRRGKACLLKGLRRAREEGHGVRWTRVCRLCRRQTAERVLAPGGWTAEAEEVSLQGTDGGRLRPDVVASAEQAVLALEVRFRHPVAPATLDQFEGLALPMLELAAHDLIDDEGKERWDGIEPLPSPACWRIPGVASPFRCDACLRIETAAPLTNPVADVLREVARAARREALYTTVRCARCAGTSSVILIPKVLKEEMTRDGSRAVVFAPTGFLALRVALDDVGEIEPRAMVFNEALLVQCIERLPELPRAHSTRGIPELAAGAAFFCPACRVPSAAALDVDELWHRLAGRNPTLLDAVRREVEAAAGLVSGALMDRAVGWAARVDAEPEAFLSDPAVRALAVRGMRGLHTGVGILAKAFGLDPALLQHLGDTLVEILLHPHRALAQRLSDGEALPDGMLMFADDVQRRLGLDGHEWRRAAWTADALLDWSHTGNTAATSHKLAGHVFKRVKTAYKNRRLPDQSHTDGWLDHAVQLGVAVRRDRDVVVLRSIDEAERSVAAFVAERRRRRVTAPVQLSTTSILDMRQEDAAWCALRHPLSIITGGAGTGKTTILRTIIASTPGEGWIVAAPTGKAMARAREMLPGLPNIVGFRTIAKLLGQLEGSGTSGDLPAFRNMALDEVSFLDTVLAGRLVRALAQKRRADGRLVLVGDPNQLPSIQAGAVLRDVLSAAGARGPSVPQVCLLRPFRSLGPITEFAYSILDGKPRLDLVEVIDAESDAALVARVQDLVASAGDRDVQVLAPRRDLVARLNHTLRPIFNPAGNQYCDGLFSGDRVVCCRNRYDEPMILNGEVGTLTVGTARSSGEIPFSIRGRSGAARGPFEMSEAQFFEPAYALTIHKAQGSEWPTVVVAIPSGAKSVDRAMLYTAATRAQTRLVLVGSRSAILGASGRVRQRMTDLESVIVDALAVKDRACHARGAPSDART